jgi:hypothetical protein
MDEDIAEFQFMMGVTESVFDWDWEGALEELKLHEIEPDGLDFRKENHWDA